MYSPRLQNKSLKRFRTAGHGQRGRTEDQEWRNRAHSAVPTARDEYRADLCVLISASASRQKKHCDSKPSGSN